MFSERARYGRRKHSGEVARYRLKREHQKDEWVTGLTGNRLESKQGQEDADTWAHLNFTKKEFLFWEKRNNRRSRNERILMWQTASQSRNTSDHNHLDSAWIRLNSPLMMKTVHMLRYSKFKIANDDPNSDHEILTKRSSYLCDFWEDVKYVRWLKISIPSAI
jgi:hypothetical protein